MNPPLIGPLTKVIPLKLFLDIVPSFLADITRALRGSFRGGSGNVSFRFVSFQSKVKPLTLQARIQDFEMGGEFL